MTGGTRVLSFKTYKSRPEIEKPEFLNPWTAVYLSQYSCEAFNTNNPNPGSALFHPK